MPNFTIEFRAMGSHIQAWLCVQQAAADAQILKQLPHWFESWEARFSRFRSNSELCRLNCNAGQWVSVSLDMGEVIGLALNAAHLTSGLFNPLILSAVEAAGYDHDFTGADYQPANRPTAKREALPGTVAVADWHMIEWDAKRHQVRLPAFARLDLGGIVKGWAAQRTADRLGEIGACLVDAGGDMAAFGAPDDSGGWQVGIAPHADPAPNAKIDSEIARYTVNLCNAGIATSGVDYRRWLLNGQPMHHLIDPRTGQPTANDILTATVIAPDAIQAEAWAKATLISGSGDLANGAGHAALLVHTDQLISWNTAFEKVPLIYHV